MALPMAHTAGWYDWLRMAFHNDRYPTWIPPECHGSFKPSLPHACLPSCAGSWEYTEAIPFSRTTSGWGFDCSYRSNKAYLHYQWKAPGCNISRCVVCCAGEVARFQEWHLARPLALDPFPSQGHSAACTEGLSACAMLPPLTTRHWRATRARIPILSLCSSSAE